MAAVVCLKDGKVAVAFDPTPDLVARARRLAGRFRQYRNFNGNVWEYPMDAVLDVATEFGDASWAVDFNDAVQKQTDDLNEVLQAAKLDESPDVLATLNETQADGNGFYEHQRFGIPWLLGVRKGILGDDMGLGKTRQALVAARILYKRDGLHTVVICPARLIDNWRKEVEKVAHPVVAVHSWAKIPQRNAREREFVLIADEAHFAQNIASQRTKRFLALAGLAKYAFLLTGTPMKNGKPVNLFPLLRAVGHPLSINKREFEKKYCRAKQVTYGRATVEDGWITWSCKPCGNHNRQRYNFRTKEITCGKCKQRTKNPRSVWDTGGASNTAELHRRIKPVLLQRMKEDVLDLPAKTRQIAQVEVTPKMRKEFETIYRQAETEYQKRVAAGTIDSAGGALALMTFIRKAASQAKIDTTLELAGEIMEQNHRPVIFTSYKDSAKTIAKALGVPCFDGDYKGGMKVVDDFQAEQLPAFVCTHDKGGVGINLTAGCYAILHDRPLTPGDADQAEDRLNRIGQTRPVTAIWLQAFDIDKVIDDLLESKRGVIRQVIAGEAEDMTSKQAGNITAQMVLKKLFA